VISGVVLAAGTSSRLGRSKQLLDLGGIPVIRHVVDAARATSSLQEVVVVLGHEAGRVAGALAAAEGLRFVINPDYAQGQSTSLRAGLRALGPEVEAAVVLLGDQPEVRSAAIDAVIEAYRSGRGPVVQASYSGIPSHPTLLARAVWEELVAGAAGDEGARGALAGHPEWRWSVEMGGSPPSDIDTETDYERVSRRFGSDNHLH
jgi:molybdenum cofactor cytidylyltransferase